MRGLTILVPSPDRTRFRAALALACAQAALGGRVRLFCQEEAVELLLDRPDPNSAALAASGLPGIPHLLETARETQVALIACQTGLAALKQQVSDLAKGVEMGGLVGLLATLGDDQLVVA